MKSKNLQKKPSKEGSEYEAEIMETRTRSGSESTEKLKTPTSSNASAGDSRSESESTSQSESVSESKIKAVSGYFQPPSELIIPPRTSWTDVETFRLIDAYSHLKDKVISGSAKWLNRIPELMLKNFGSVRLVPKGACVQSSPYYFKMQSLRKLVNDYNAYCYVDGNMVEVKGRAGPTGSGFEDGVEVERSLEREALEELRAQKRQEFRRKHSEAKLALFDYFNEKFPNYCSSRQKLP